MNASHIKSKEKQKQDEQQTENRKPNTENQKPISNAVLDKFAYIVSTLLCKIT